MSQNFDLIFSNEKQPMAPAGVFRLQSYFFVFIL